MIYVNDNHIENSESYISGYNGNINNVCGFQAQFFFNRKGSDWYLNNEAYPDFNILEQRLTRVGNAPSYIVKKMDIN